MKSKIKHSLLLFFTVISAALFLMLKNETSLSVFKGIELCGQVLIPSLFPLMLLASVSINTRMFMTESRLVKLFMNHVFRLPSAAFSAVLFGFTGGYPVGPKVVASLYEGEEINFNEARLLLSFCVNPGPAFCISAVGGSLLGSRQAGYIIFASVTAASLLTGIAYSRFLKLPGLIENGSVFKKYTDTDFSEQLINSVNSSASSILSVCAWVITFSAFSAIIKPFIRSETVLLLFEGVFEITSGVVSAFKAGGLPLAAAAVSFGGICVLFQNISQIKKCGMKIANYLHFRIAESVLSFFTAKILSAVLNINVSVYSAVSPSIHFAPASASLLIMCAILLFDTAAADRDLHSAGRHF